MKLDKKNILIGAGVVVVGYLLWKKSQKDELNKRVQNITKSDEIQRDSLGMPQIRANTIEEERAMSIAYFKTLPDSFTIDNVNYTKNSNLEFYKTPFIPNSFSGVQPIKISGADFNNAYIKFRDKDLPKSALELKFGSYVEPTLKM
jgi:hypothetical protein